MPCTASNRKWSSAPKIADFVSSRQLDEQKELLLKYLSVVILENFRPAAKKWLFVLALIKEMI